MNPEVLCYGFHLNLQVAMYLSVLFVFLVVLKLSYVLPIEVALVRLTWTVSNILDSIPRS